MRKLRFAEYVKIKFRVRVGQFPATDLTSPAHLINAKHDTIALHKVCIPMLKRTFP